MTETSSGSTERGTPSVPTIEFFSDIHCPWAYMALYRLRKVFPDYSDRVRIAFRSLSLELQNGRCTPKPILDVEFLLIAQQEPEIPIHPWRSPEWQFVPTLLPAFEAEKAAALQGDDAAWEFSWRVRHAFFYRSRTICMRNELESVAHDAGLDSERFLKDWDSGLLREPVLADTERGWNKLQVAGSPTFVLPNGKQIHNPGGWRVEWSRNHLDVKSIDKDVCPRGDCLQPFREMLNEAIAVAE
jgi:predicted DsbA family dithiol-disulfide isomerase